MYEGISRSSMAPSDDFNTLPKTLLPRRLGITDHCQHVSVVEARVKGETSGNTMVSFQFVLRLKKIVQVSSFEVELKWTKD